MADVVTMTILLCPQVYIRILDNEWNVYRRYAEFRELHNHLRTQFPQVDAFNFPPKKAIGNKVSYKPVWPQCSFCFIRTSAALSPLKP